MRYQFGVCMFVCLCGCFGHGHTHILVPPARVLPARVLQVGVAAFVDEKQHGRVQDVSITISTAQAFFISIIEDKRLRQPQHHFPHTSIKYISTHSCKRLLSPALSDLAAQQSSTLAINSVLLLASSLLGKGCSNGT